MRRTVLSAVALACIAVPASTGAAFADAAAEALTHRPAANVSPADASPVPVPTAEPSEASPASPVPTVVPSEASPAPASPVPTTEPAAASPVPTTEPSDPPAEGQVSVVPSGAPDTGVTAEPHRPGKAGAGLIGGAAAVLVAGGATAFAVRRRRATGA
ncbi:Tat pathway signal sequence domain protein [Streptomyces sp. F63]|uniref:Tat pathway signal sequence domain protein n=1 Tax=Streptomyces sp. F63 TaxID=2824887 RepID=UPI001B364B83|nr:Tat pathway signal sequence domain protein [Streptomyces sp. F63]MBQ0983373.1 Tat pathway signal sequence domain protein [Streptomyces sp. F63]